MKIYDTGKNKPVKNKESLIFQKGIMTSMTNTELDVSDELWKTFTDDQKIRHIHDNLVQLRKENKENTHVCPDMQRRVAKLERKQKWKNIFAFLGGIIGGIIGSKGKDMF